MSASRFVVASGFVVLAAYGCGSTSADGPTDPAPTVDGGDGGGSEAGCGAGEARCQGACETLRDEDKACGAGRCAVACAGGQHCVAGTCQGSKIEHVVVVVQENHTFDSYFGRFCEAPTGSNPTCTMGRKCCEAAPEREPGGAAPLVHDDDPNNAGSNFKSDRDHEQACELQQIHGGLMDRFVKGASGGATCLGVGPSCSSDTNWVLAKGASPSDSGHAYFELADTSALADRYFQPIAGGTASNDMYFAGAHFRFVDNVRIPKVAVGTSGDRLCTEKSVPGVCINDSRASYAADTIGSLLLDHGKTFAVYADGYARALEAAKKGACADPGEATECPYNSCFSHPIACNACLFDPSDVPFLYYERFAETGSGATLTPSPIMKDYAALAADLESGKLPSFAYVKARLYRNEHPNTSTIADGQRFVKDTIDAILGSPKYAANTLVILTWDEGGGFFDHVPPPAAPPTTVDADDSGKPVPYGTRVPMLAIGPFAKQGAVSHVVMEHSSIVKFLEWNFLTDIGQLGARDGWVNNIGSLLDPGRTGVPVPEK